MASSKEDVIFRDNGASVAVALVESTLKKFHRGGAVDRALGGGLFIEVYPINVKINGTVVNYAGTTSNAVTDNATNNVYLDNGGLLTVTTSAFPSTNIYKLARVITSGGAVTQVFDEKLAAEVTDESGGSFVSTGGDTMTGDLKFNDAVAAVFGTDSDVNIEFDNVAGELKFTGTGTVNIANTLKLGTVSTGTWNGTTIGAAYGGTGIDTSGVTGVPSISAGAWSTAPRLANTLGGTGIDSSAETGVVSITAGTWSVGTIPNALAGTNAISFTINDDGAAALNEDAYLILKGGDGVAAPNDDLVKTQIYQDSSAEQVRIVTFRNRNGGGDAFITTEVQIGDPTNATARNALLTFNGGTGTAAATAQVTYTGTTDVIAFTGASAYTFDVALGLSSGGTNASLVANNGGIIYSTASAMAVLAGTATANQVLLSGSTAAPAWSTATYPATTTINQLLYSSSANTISGLATANSSILVTSGAGVPSLATDIPTAVTIGGSYIYRAGGTDLPLADGGTGASLTASNGGIIYSTASAMAVLAGTATANQVLLSGTSAAPSWSTATYPATTTANQLLYSSATNTIGGLATANSSILVTSGAGVPSLATDIPTAVTIGSAYVYRAGGTDVAQADGGTGIDTSGATNGQILIGETTGGTLALASITETADQVLVANGANTITLSLPQSIATTSTVRFLKVGLGGAASTPVHVTQAVATSDAAYRITNGSITHSIYSDSAGRLTFLNGGVASGSWIMGGTGQMGIGTAPTQQLHVVSTNASGACAITQSTNAATALSVTQNTAATCATFVNNSTQNTMIVDHNDIGAADAMDIQYSGSGAAIDLTAVAHIARIDSDITAVGTPFGRVPVLIGGVTKYLQVFNA